MTRVRRLLLLPILLLLWISPARAAIGFVTAGVNKGNNVSALTITPDAATGGGNTVVVGVAMNSASASVTSVTDSGGSAYSLRERALAGTIVEIVEIWSTTAGGSVNSTTVTVTLSGQAKMVAIAASYSGVAQLGATSWTGNSGSANPSRTAWVQDSQNWLVAMFGARTNTVMTAGTGNLRKADATSGGQATSNSSGGFVDNTTSSPGNGTDSVMLASRAWVVATLELRSSTTAPLVQNNLISVNAAQPTISKRFTLPTSAGNLLYAVVSWTSAPGSPDCSLATVTVADELSQSGTQIQAVNDPTNNRKVWSFYFPTTAAGVRLVTATTSSASPYCGSIRLFIGEYNGVAASSPLDVSAGPNQQSPGTGTAGATSGAMTPTTEGDLLLATIVSTGATAPTSIAPGTDYVGDTQSPGALPLMMSAHRGQASAGSIAGTFTLDSSQPVTTLADAFTPPGGAPAGIRRTLLGVGQYAGPPAVWEGRG